MPEAQTETYTFCCAECQRLTNGIGQCPCCNKLLCETCLDLHSLHPEDLPDAVSLQDNTT